MFLNNSKASTLSLSSISSSKRQRTATTTPINDPTNSLIVPPGFTTIASVQESSARVLFLMINWLRSQAQFSLIPLSDQIYLIEQNWKDLLLASLVQWMVPIHLVNDIELLQSSEALKRQGVEADQCLAEFKRIQEIFSKLVEMNLEPVELDLFKMLLMVRADSLSHLRNEQGIKLVQANVVKSLFGTVGVNGSKLASILLLTSEVHNKVSENAIEMILFKYFIGELSMKKIVVELFETGLRC